MITRTELLVPEPAQALAGLLDTEAPTEYLPALWHWVYLLERPAQADLGADGHPARSGVPAPPGPGLRRMFAGGRVRIAGPGLRLGDPATRRSQIARTIEKAGRTGPLTFSTVVHRIEQGGTEVVVDEQNIVYRAAVGDAAAPVEPAAPAEQLPGAGEVDFPINPVRLFRFSALTYNSHRIHYDRGYAHTVEGYPGLLVHGPLQALLMAEHARAAAGQAPLFGVDFSYRLVAPLFDFQGLVIGATPKTGSVTTRVRDRSGRVTATGNYATAATTPA